MFSRRRGKKALERLRANAAACVSARLRPCCAKRSGPKISERFGPFERAAPGVEDLAQLGWRVGHQPQQVGRSHPVVKGPAKPPRRRARR